MEINDIKDINFDDIKVLQSKELEVLVYFKEFCDKHNLKFYFCGGCMIGALRHQGFIPWDDDVDIFMPRPDYERLAELWNNEADTSKYVYCRTNEKSNYHHAGSSIRNVNTTFINKHCVHEDIVHGIGIEMVPIDGYPNSAIMRYKQLFFAFLFSLFNTQRLPDNKGKVIRLVSQIAYFLVPSKKLRYKVWRFAEKQMSKHKWEDCQHVTELIGSIKGMLLKHPKEWFDSVVYKEFEGFQMPLMAGYEQYLTLIFGDYMTEPPVENRIAKHNTVYINTEESYEKYKGIYYLVTQEK